MKNFKMLVLVIGLVFSSMSIAIPVTGFNDVTDNLDGTFTFTFDSYIGSPILGGTDGLLFSGFGIDITVTSSSEVIQDGLVHGGLGTLGGPDTRINQVPGASEQINFNFNRRVDLVYFTVNGLGSSDGHTDEADGLIAFSAISPSVGLVTTSTSADFYDGIADTSFDGDIAANFQSIGRDFFSDIDAMVVRANGVGGWEGYVESLTLRLNDVPEPSVMALFGLGFVGLVITQRRRRRRSL